jgi:hypothetical protein
MNNSREENNMLDLSGLAPQIEKMAEESRLDLAKYSYKINNARTVFDDYDKNPSLWLDKINSDNRHFFVAFPQGRISDVFPLPKYSLPYTAVAVDGSQIDVDTHEVALCYVLNAGRIAIHYGTGERPYMDSVSKLFYRDEDLYKFGENGLVLIQGDRIAELRLMMEASELKKMISRHRKEDVPLVALVDGRLVSWDRTGAARKDPSAFSAPHFEETFKIGQLHKIPIAGYVSGSRTSLVVNTLRAKDCLKSIMNCVNCEHKNERDANCHQIEGVRDTAVFNAILKLGERSCYFYGGINSLPSNNTPLYRIGFFYVNVGSEIARVEAPDYVLEDKDLLNLLHWVVFDQAQKGMGYPISLQEAHHFAVIKGEEKEKFYHILKQQLARHGIPLKITHKKLGKISRIF